MTNNTHLK